MKHFTLSVALSLCVGSFSFGQTLLNEKLIELTKDQQKNEMEFALFNPNTQGATVLFESQKAEKVKGQKRTYERYEMVLDKELNVVAGEYKALGTKNAIKPRIYYKDFRIAYYLDR
mgnify:CR=1 FL=1